MTRQKLFVLGPPRLERDGQPVALQLRRALALLAYLAVTNQPQSRETLAALLWPESDEGEARGRLRRTLHRLVDAVGEDTLLVEGASLRAASPAALWVDALAFQEHADRGLASTAGIVRPDSDGLAHLTTAAALYGDDFLAGFTLPDSPAWDEWQFYQGEGFRQTCARVLERLAAIHQAREAWQEGIDAARRWLALDPLHEPAHRALMELYAHAGQHAAALRQYQQCVRVLQSDLDVAPEIETTRLYEAIKSRHIGRGVNGDLPAIDAGRPSRAGYSLPPQTTSFIGRARELSTLKQLLEDEPACRLVTILGPGGIGKTRLALAAAAAASGAFPDGVFFAPLAPLASAGQLESTLADAVGFRYYQANDPKHQFLAYLREKRLLLVLDNFEHLLEGAGLLLEILAAAPHTRLLVTSRERLNLSSETVFTLGGMTLPDAASLHTALRSDAVQLLILRARLARPDLEIRDLPLEPIVRICRLVQGMPLAIELAAGWLEALSLAGIADEIGRSLDFLESDARDLPARQRSVRATFEQSWARLPAEQQRAFAQLSVFRGGFTRQSAMAVSDADLRALRALVNRSFLSVDGGDRYHMHELLRQYGAAQLDASGEGDRARDAHCAVFAALLRRRTPDLHGGGQVEALDLIEADLDNIRSAWEWALRRGNDAAADHAAEALHLFFTMRARYAEGAQLFRLARDHMDRRPSGLRARVLATLAFMEMMANPASRDAAVAIEESLAIARDAGDQRAAAFSLFRTGCYHFIVTHDIEQARRFFTRSLDQFRAVDEPFYIANVLAWLGECYDSATDLGTLEAYSRDGLETARRTGNRFIASNLLGRLVIVSLGRGDYAAAERYGQDALAIQEAMRHSNGVADSRAQLALVRLLRGDLVDASRLVNEAYTVARKVNYPLFIAQALAVLALHAATTGDERLARQLGEESLATSTGSFMEVILGNWALAIAYCGLADYATASRHLRAAMEPARELRFMGMVVWPLAVAPAILAADGQKERAVEVIALVSEHPLGASGWLEAWPHWTALRDMLRSDLGPDAFAAAWERGAKLDLETVTRDW